MRGVQICHVGYVTLFPFLLGLLEPNAPQLPALLSVMEDPEQLWSPFGLRSLSRSDPLFATKENYWRGAVWINCNFLALKVRDLLSFVEVYGTNQQRGGLATADIEATWGDARTCAGACPEAA